MPMRVSQPVCAAVSDQSHRRASLSPTLVALSLPEPGAGMDSWRGGACVLGPVVFYLSPHLPMLSVNDRLTPHSVPDRGSVPSL